MKTLVECELYGIILITPHCVVAHFKLVALVLLLGWFFLVFFSRKGNFGKCLVMTAFIFIMTG